MNMRRVGVASVAVLALVFCSGLLRADDKERGEQKKPASCTPEQKDPQRHEGFMKDKEAQLQKGPVQLVFLGDSITDGWRSGGKQAFDENFGKYNTLNLGISGDRTEHVLWRIDHGELDDLHPKAVMLMIGTNNLGRKQSVEDTIAGIKCDVAAIHEKLPEARILLLAVFPRGAKPDDQFRGEIKQVNEAISQLDGKENVKYLDIGPRFLDDMGELPKDIMPDALHPNQKGYEIWAEAMKVPLEELMKD